MPTVAENLERWNETYGWGDAGEEWSEAFGGTEALWWFILYPRIHRFLPAGTVLEIAPGFGRWTQFLRAHCRSLIGVDLTPKCVEHCRQRFAADAHLRFHVNDGRSLAAVPDQSIDFLFSFDSLVHADKDVLEAYVHESARKLRPSGVGFIHHSNMGAYPGYISWIARFRRARAFLRRQPLNGDRAISTRGWRSTSMTADLFVQFCRDAGLSCIAQELFSWHKGKPLADTISIFTLPGSSWDHAPLRVENRLFLQSAAATARLAKIYCHRAASLNPPIQG